MTGEWRAVRPKSDQNILRPVGEVRRIRTEVGDRLEAGLSGTGEGLRKEDSPDLGWGW